MSSAFAMVETDRANSPVLESRSAATPLQVEALSLSREQEVLAFLRQRSLHTVFMAGLIRDNGLTSSCNRGTFYGCRDHEGKLEGVALVGQKTLVEARTQRASATLTPLASSNLGAHLVRGEEPEVQVMLDHYRIAGRQPRLLSREVLMEQLTPAPSIAAEPGLRLARTNDLPIVTSINAHMVLEETGIAPMLRDPQGMLERTERRITQGRVWILTRNDHLIFKADVIAATPEAVFLEGVYVRAEERRQGNGLRCMTQLARNLLAITHSVCLVVREQNHTARAFYEKAGFKFSSHYNTAHFDAKSGA